MSKVLVTGGSGFIAGHCIAQLLTEGHEVRTTVRNLGKAGAVRAQVTQALGSAAGRDKTSPVPQLLSSLTFAAADLLNDDGWNAAVEGCEFVHHVASPFPLGVPRSDDELIVPAREGTLRVLQASRRAGVRRVILTSSFAAIGYGHPDQPSPFDETSWTNLEGPGLTAYVKSKTIAERAAWDFVASQPQSPELAVVNPVAVFGPVLGADMSTSVVFLQRMLAGRLPGCPQLSFGLVDVRDVADLHLRAMSSPAAKGERFLAVAGDFLSMREIALALKSRLGPRARKVSTFELPNWVVRLSTLLDPSVKQVTAELGKHKNATNAKARRVLGWSPRSSEDALEASGESMYRLGLL